MPFLDEDPSGQLRGILEEPEDLGRRLVYTDWLEENDEPERADFIRKSCWILDKNWPLAKRKELKAEVDIVTTTGRLFDHLGDTLNSAAPGMPAVHTNEIGCSVIFSETPAQPLFSVEMRGGFVRTLWITTDVLFGEACTACQGMGKLWRQMNDGPGLNGQYDTCGYCHGDRYVGANLLDVFKEHPIQDVYLTDREPYPTGHLGTGTGPDEEVTWCHGGRTMGNRGSSISMDLPAGPADEMGAEWWTMERFDHPKAAWAFASEAVVRYGRRHAGLTLGPIKHPIGTHRIPADFFRCGTHRV